MARRARAYTTPRRTRPTRSTAPGRCCTGTSGRPSGRWVDRNKTERVEGVFEKMAACNVWFLWYRLSRWSVIEYPRMSMPGQRSRHGPKDQADSSHVVLYLAPGMDARSGGIRRRFVDVGGEAQARDHPLPTQGDEGDLALELLVPGPVGGRRPQIAVNPSSGCHARSYWYA
jgi:hypothetical protein